MRKRGGFMLLMIIIMAYIALMPATVYGQSGPRIPLDEEGNIYMQQQGYSIIITGIVFGENAPPTRQELLTKSGPDCAHVDLVHEWDCDNPARFGRISLIFGKTLQIYFDPECDGEICFYPAGVPSSGPQPERAEICFNGINGNGIGDADLSAVILDNCDTPLKSRNIPMSSRVDMEEVVQFSVTITSNVENFQFPSDFYGKVFACGLETMIMMMKFEENESSANYRSYTYRAREFATTFCTGGALSFSANYISSAGASATMTEVDFRITAINFVNDIPINNNFGTPAACYPFGEHLSFVTTVKVMRRGWPTDCQYSSGTVNG